MIGSSWIIFLKTLGPKFSSYLLPKFKNKKFVRDIKDKWVKDNYTQKITLMFKAAFDDAKTVLNLPDELAIALLEDSINRSEVFRWILEGTPSNINLDKLNLDPYFESYQEYQDLIRPFFELIASSLNDYKIKNWEPEFLELLYKTGTLEETIEEGFNSMIDKQILAIDLAEENNRYLREVITPTEFKDLNDLMKKGLLKSAREKAIERLDKPNIKPDETLELHIVIANTYIGNKEFENAIPHLYTAITHCKDEARKERLLALINILEERFNKAEVHVKEAIKMVGETPENINVLLNILTSQSRFKEAIDIIEKQPEQDYEEIKANIWIVLEEFEKVINLTNEKLKNDQLNITWLLIKAEAIVLKVETDLSRNKIIYPELTFQEVLPLLESIENHTTEKSYILDRVKELKACLYFRTNRFSEAKILYEELFQKNKNFSSTTFNNLLLNIIGSNEWEKSVNLLEEKKTKQGIDLDEMLILADSYINTGTPEKAVQLLKENYFQNPIENIFSYYAKYIDGLYAQLKHSEIIDLIDSLSIKESNISIKNILNGYYAYKKQDWDNTIYLLEPNLDKFNNKDVASAKIILSVAYFNKQTKDDYKKLKEIIVTIPNWIQHESLVNRYIQALYHLNEYRTIIDLEERLPFKSTAIFEIITTIYFNHGWYEKAKENYLSLYQQTRELRYQLRYANCFYQLGNIKTSLEVLSAAEIEVNKHGNIEDYQLISFAYKEAMEYRKSMSYAYKAFMAGKSYAQIWGFYFYHFSTLSQFIDEPEESWIKEYQNVMENFETTFPDEEPILKKITIPENGDISPELISNLKLPKESFEELIPLFIKHKLPINFLVKVLNKGPFETWAFVINNKELPIRIINGSIEEVVSGLKMALSTKEILCDFTTLLMLSDLKLLEMLKSEFKLYIQQEQFDAALQEYYNNKVSIHNGIKIMSYENEKIQVTEYSPEQVRETVKNQEFLLNWIKENCILVGNTIKNQVSKPEEISFIESIFEICKNQSLHLLIDSVTIRDIAKNEHNINCISTLDIINLLKFKNMYTQQERTWLIGKLLMANYTLIPITEEVFANHLKEKNYVMDYEMQLLLDYLKNEDFNIEFLIDLVSSILYWLWTEIIPIKERQIITNKICESICSKRSKDIIIPSIIESCETKFKSKPFFVYQKPQLQQSLNKWLEK
ncbi:tetratricopeptide repeat protein [Bacillus sp. Hm123]|uniref:tetratricopeptide repeat protein n=1 Tax=Bacillus sp. Hm123 TaxID=3450745 RepID=UPI003F431192